MSKETPTRRSLLLSATKTGLGATAGYLLTTSIAHAASPVRTPPQMEGPFYPVKDQLDKDADMTRVQGHAEAAAGQRVQFAGRVVDGATGQPIAGALVEFWQACTTGKYDHPDDPNPAELDPYFQYWAQVRTDADGHFDILTIVPGAYPADENWMRPPHIHVKVHQVGYPSLTTQVYFEGHSLNASDLILQRLSPEDRRLVTVRLAGERLAKRWDVFIVRRAPGSNPRERASLRTPALD